MKERPILFSAPMVRAILAGTKTQTRRVVKPQTVRESLLHEQRPHWIDAATGKVVRCPYGQPGDRLWVRETFSQCLNLGADRKGNWPAPEGMFSVSYAATDGLIGDRWKPSIHMPRNLSRILLEVVSVRVERLQDISEEDCVAEGCAGGHGSIPGYYYSATPREHYRWLWQSINGPESWDANPLVWVVEFRKVQP